jgi:ribosomal protein S6
MANHYETVFILTPVLSEEQAKEAVGKYKKLLSRRKLGPAQTGVSHSKEKHRVLQPASD